MENFCRGLLIGCILVAMVRCDSEDAVRQQQTAAAASPRSGEYEDDIAAAEDHEHHRIIIVVPKEVPHHVNHVHTYKLADKGIPLIHSGKVVHDHKHSGKVAHEHGHVGKSTHNHKHAGAYGHNHKHNGYLGHKHFGKVDAHGGGKYYQSPQYQQSPVEHQTLVRQGHKLQHNQQVHATDYLSHQQAGGFGQLKSARRPVSGQVHFVPSSQPQGLGSFMPSEIQTFVDGRHGGIVGGAIVQQQQQHQYVAAEDDVVQTAGGPPAEYNVIHLRVPDQNGPNVIKHVDIDLANNVAKLQTADKFQPIHANYNKAVAQYNKVIGHGRAKQPTAEDELFDTANDDEDVGGGGGGGGGGGAAGGGGGSGGYGVGDGELSLEEGGGYGGYRFGEGYRLAMGSAADGRGFLPSRGLDDDEADEFRESPDSADYSVESRAYSPYLNF